MNNNIYAVLATSTIQTVDKKVIPYNDEFKKEIETIVKPVEAIEPIKPVEVISNNDQHKDDAQIAYQKAIYTSRAMSVLKQDL